LEVELRKITAGAAALLAACSGQADPSSEAGAPEESTGTQMVEWRIDDASLLFSATRDGSREIHRRDGSDGTTVVLSIEPGTQNSGRYSPDGGRIAYQSWNSGASEIFVTDADDWSPVNVSRDEAHDVLPVWSPDGEWIAFMSTRGFTMGELGPFPGHIYAARPDGTGVRQLTTEPLTSSLGPQDWSPDGSTILLSRIVNGSPDLFVLDVGSGEEYALTETPTGEYGAAYSPDGRRIAFHNEEGGVSQIEIMDADGAGRVTLTSGPGLRYGPRWSPDGGWLVYTAAAEGESTFDIRALRVEDGSEVALVATPGDEGEASWRPGTQ